MMMDIFDDIFAQMDAWTRYPFAENGIKNSGLKGLIPTPHNLYTVKNDLPRKMSLLTLEMAC